MAWRGSPFRRTFQNTVLDATRPKADPFGWIEAELIAGGDFWHGLVSTSTLFDISSELCALLFGVANTTGWKPLFAGRGVPENVSDAFFAHWSGCRSEFIGESWVSLDELEAIDWTQTIQRDAAPTLIAEPKLGERYWNGRAGFPLIEPAEFADLRILATEERVSAGERTLVHRQLRLEDAKHGTRYPLLLDLMRAIQRHSEGSVRWVVAFSE